MKNLSSAEKVYYSAKHLLISSILTICYFSLTLAGSTCSTYFTQVIQKRATVLCDIFNGVIILEPAFSFVIKSFQSPTAIKPSLPPPPPPLPHVKRGSFSHCIPAGAVCSSAASCTSRCQCRFFCITSKPLLLW